MDADEVIYAGGFRPGDEVTVVDGTFVGMEGTVLGPTEAKTLQKQNGGQKSCYDIEPGCVWVRLSIYERLVPILLLPDQIARR